MKQKNQTPKLTPQNTVVSHSPRLAALQVAACAKGFVACVDTGMFWATEPIAEDGQGCCPDLYGRMDGQERPEPFLAGSLAETTPPPRFMLLMCFFLEVKIFSDLCPGKELQTPVLVYFFHSFCGWPRQPQAGGTQKKVCLLGIVTKYVFWAAYFVFSRDSFLNSGSVY